LKMFEESGAMNLRKKLPEVHLKFKIIRPLRNRTIPKYFKIVIKLDAKWILHEKKLIRRKGGLLDKHVCLW